jgi:16S rRNA processing protein RimM
MTPPPAEWAWLARIRRPQGRKGEVFADLLTDFPEKFSQRRQLWLIAEERPSASGTLPPRQVTLEAHWLHKGGVVLHFQGVDSISAAEAMKGLVVAVPHADRVPLGEDEAYIADLSGCVILNVAGPHPVTIGTIEDVDRTAGPVPLLVVHRDEKEILVPFAKSYLKAIDLQAKRIEMALPEGLIDLND